MRTAERNEVMQTLREHGLSSAAIHRQDPPVVAVDAGKGELQVWRDAKKVFGASCRPAPGLGRRELEDLPAARQPRLRRQPSTRRRRATDPGLHVHLTFDPRTTWPRPSSTWPKPRVAILREQGVNSHVEMAYAFTEAGFEAWTCT
jgi:phosphoribosylformylglycinamidine synthase